MATIHDVAKKAGVAPITVSRVINQSGYCSSETRQRVEEAITELGYVPNTLARSLRSKRTNTLALILTDITNPFFTTLARGVEDAANAAGFTVIFCNSDESEVKEQKYLNVLLQKQVDGFLVVPACSNTDAIARIQRQGAPVVVIDRRIPESNTDVVRCDSEGGAYQLTQLLQILGHRQIAALSGPVEVSTAADRAAGYLRAMQEAGVAAEDCPVFYGEFTQESGYEMAGKAIRLPLRPTALLALNNFITIGAMKALQDVGLQVPEDIALAGFDDLPPGLVTFPFFTVAAQPAYEMGRRATLLLLDRLSGQAGETPQEIVLPTEIIIRRSSGEHIR
jgi:LacI family transcriptional regulator